MSNDIYQDMFSFVEVLLGDATVKDCFWDLVEFDDECGLGRMLENCEDVVSGASKIVFTFEEFPDYVIKIPNPGDVGYPFLRQESSFFWYEGNKHSKERWNYCSSEIFLFQEAKKAKVDKFFAELVFLGKTRGGVPVYAQKKYKFLSQKLPISNDIVDKDFVLEIFEDDKDVDSLIAFMDKWDIDDIYSDNCGITDDGKPIIIDYAGFYD